MQKTVDVYVFPQKIAPRAQMESGQMRRRGCEGSSRRRLATKPGGKCGLKGDDEPQTFLHLAKDLAVQHPHAISEEAFIDCQDLRYVDDGIMGQASSTLSAQHIAGGSGQPQIRGDRNHNNSADAALVELIALYNKDRPAITGT